MAFVTNNTIQNIPTTYAEISEYNDVGYTDRNVMPGSSLLYQTLQAYAEYQEKPP